MNEFIWTKDPIVGEHCQWKGMNAYASSVYCWVIRGNNNSDRIFDSFTAGIRVDRRETTKRLCEMAMRCAALNEVQEAVFRKE